MLVETHFEVHLEATKELRTKHIYAKCILVHPNQCGTLLCSVCPTICHKHIIFNLPQFL